MSNVDGEKSFKNNSGDHTQRQDSSRYAIKSNKYSPHIKELMGLEDDVTDLVREVKFHKVKK